MTRDELAALDELVSPLLKKGQPLGHIMAEHGNEIPCSMRTIYTYIDNGYLTIKNLDMRRRVRYKKRRHPYIVTVNHRKKEGRHYEDFKELLEEYPEQRVVEMDTVEGIKGGKLLQTFLWRESNLMLAILIDNKEMENTVTVFDMLEELLGLEIFKKLFPVILTDNGTEFSAPERFETGRDGERRTKMYYCDPRMSQQKGALEKNHGYIRYVLPKGTSFDDLTQEKIKLLINHINNTARPGFHGLTPMKLAERYLNKEVMEKLGLEYIHGDEIHLRRELLK